MAEAVLPVRKRSERMRLDLVAVRTSVNCSRLAVHRARMISVSK